MSLRPIAPAMDVYAAACNPPRKAKRSRPDTDDDDDDDPTPPRRRGRRPGTLSRAAREAQRKINHSLIEKARRTKINDALATLRELVPAEYKRPAESHPDDSDDDDDPKPRQKPKAEKEFKLEILVRTVAYLQDLTDRVSQLERDGCPRCSGPISVGAPSPASLAGPSLPSISAWLPEDQRCLLTPPALDAARPTQLPTPPASVSCAPATAGYQIPPVLTLPSPSTFHIQPRFSGFTPRPRRSPSSPTYTPDDETAASLLLRMSSTSHTSALTPSRLLGLNAER